MKLIMNKVYSDESMIHIDEEINEAISIACIPTDEHGFHKGSFVVRVEHVMDEEND